MGHIPHGMLNTATDPTKTITGESHDQTQNRSHGDEQHRQSPIDQQHKSQVGQHLQTVLNECSEGIRARIAQLGHGKGDLRNNVALGCAVKIAAGGLHNVAKQLLAQIVDHAKGHSRHGGFANNRSPGTQHGHHCHHHGNGRRRPDLGVVPTVYQITKQAHKVPFRCRCRNKSNKGDDQQWPIVPHVSQQPTIDRPV